MNQAILNRARNDKFLMVLDLPKALKKMTDSVLDSSYSADPIQFTCYGSPVPSISVPSIDIPFGGQVYKISSNSRPSYPALTLSFVVDNGWKNYWILWNWLNLFNDERSSVPSYNFSRSLDPEKVADRDKTPFSDMVSRFSTYALDEFNNKIISFEYTAVFPTALTEINFSHQDANEISCKVSFAYFQMHTKLLKNVDKNACL